MKKFFRSPVVTGLTFLLAVVMLFAGTVGVAQAALSIFSGNYLSNIYMQNIGVDLLQGTKYDGSDAEPATDVVATMLGKAKFQPGISYPFVLSVKNTGAINQYVRVSVYKYWSDSNGKRVDRDPNLIQITPANTSRWVQHDSTSERLVFYHQGVLASGATSVPLTASLMVDNSVLNYVKSTTTTEPSSSGNVTKTHITYTYAFDGMDLTVDVVVDAVQEHNIAKAALSAWGVPSSYVGA